MAKISSEKPVKLKAFLERIKAKQRSSPKNETKLGPNSLTDHSTPCKNSVDLRTQSHQKSVTFDKNLVDNNSENSRTIKISDNTGHKGSKSPSQNLPNRRKSDSNASMYPERFSDIRSFMNLSEGVVRSSNFYRVEKPSFELKERKGKRRYKILKKEEVLVGSSSNTIKKYFPLKVDTNICKNGKRKSSIEETESLKKARVGNRATD